MNRRNFLMLSGVAGGTCLIPAAIARRIRDVCLGNSQPLILAPERFSFDLHAEECFGRYTLHLGDPNEEPDYPTLREFVEDKGYSPDDRRSLRDYLINWRGYDVPSEGRTSPVIDQLVTMLDDPIDGYERSQWMDWDFEMHDSPMARAYSYLLDLPLDDEKPPDDFDLGSLSFMSFINGLHPRSNFLAACVSYFVNENDQVQSDNPRVVVFMKLK